MGEKFCLDKRIAYLGFFTGILILIVTISVIVNNTKIYQNSKASEINPGGGTTQKKSSSSSVSENQVKLECLDYVKKPGEDKLNLSLSKNPGFNTSNLVGIFAITDGGATLLTYVESNSSAKPLAVVDIELLQVDIRTTFMAIQHSGNSQNTQQGTLGQVDMTTDEFMLKNKNCNPYTRQF